MHLPWKRIFPTTILILTLCIIPQNIVAQSTEIFRENFDSYAINEPPTTWNNTIGDGCQIKVRDSSDSYYVASPNGGNQLWIYSPGNGPCYLERSFQHTAENSSLRFWLYDNLADTNAIEYMLAVKDGAGNSFSIGVSTSRPETGVTAINQGYDVRFYTTAGENRYIETDIKRGPRAYAPENWHLIEVVQKNGVTKAIIDGVTTKTETHMSGLGVWQSIKLFNSQNPAGAIRLDGIVVDALPTLTATITSTPDPESQQLYQQIMSRLPIASINTAPYGEEASFDARITQLTDKTYLIDHQHDIERFEVTLSQRYPHIYGAGRSNLRSKNALDDFTDIRFSSGHDSFPSDEEIHVATSAYNDPSLTYNGDTERLRTPLFIIPSIPLLIAYIDQPDVKQVRLERNADSTVAAFSKRTDADHANTGKLLLVTGDTVSNVYEEYYSALKGQQYSFKKPHWNTFGLYYETYGEYGCSATLDQLETEVYKTYRDNNIPLSLFTIGSGYWGSANLSGCGESYQQDTTTDTFSISEERYRSQEDFTSFLNTLLAEDIYPIIGMRHNFYGSEENLKKLEGSGYFNTSRDNYLINDSLYFGTPPSNNVYLLNFEDPSIINSYLNMISTYYSPSIKGFKEDEMVVGDQNGYYQTLNDLPPTVPKSFQQDWISNVYKEAISSYNNDIVLIGSNDYLGVATDAQNTQGYLGGGHTSSNENSYLSEYVVDAMLDMVFSGYPRPVSEHVTNTINCPQNNLLDAVQQRAHARTIQLATFFPVDMQTCNFWDGLLSPDLRTTAFEFSKLRNQLHKYAYDKSQDWYATGIPQLMKPLYLEDSWQDDSMLPSLYDGSNDDSNGPTKQFMFGNALLIRPVLKDSNVVNVYLPSGQWKNYFTGLEYAGAKTINYTLKANFSDYPVFIREGEIMISQDGVNNYEAIAKVFMKDMTESSVYRYYIVDNDPNTTDFIPLIARKAPNDEYEIVDASSTHPLRIPLIEESPGSHIYSAHIKYLISSYIEDTPSLVRDFSKDYTVLSTSGASVYTYAKLVSEMGQ